ncbi:cobalt-precorrin-6A reductase [Nocardia higoensis]|uniref:cobalt-precorrin-6A reductase n=1 Tax=Nocardia higoensis TaxID=228599 RepID=UPI001E6588EE|nr:cobalt-precorrin-6A reductase [Nocardia higoensis]
MGGTGEARELARIASGERGVDIVSSLAGRVRDPRLPEGEVRIGGFGGAEGLRTWLSDNAIDRVVDATHPFAATIGANASHAAAAAAVPLLRLLRPAWIAGPGDHWIAVPDLAAAARAVGAGYSRVFLTIGRQGVGAFAGLTEPWFLIRAIDPPTAAVPPHHELLLARGPFSVAEEIALLSRHAIDVLVTKNSGGDQTEAKLEAARQLRIPVVMIDRPPASASTAVVGTAGEAWTWLASDIAV